MNRYTEVNGLWWRLDELVHDRELLSYYYFEDRDRFAACEGSVSLDHLVTGRIEYYGRSRKVSGRIMVLKARGIDYQETIGWTIMSENDYARLFPTWVFLEKWWFRKEDI